MFLNGPYCLSATYMSFRRYRMKLSTCQRALRKYTQKAYACSYTGIIHIILFCVSWKVRGVKIKSSFATENHRAFNSI